MCVIIITNPEHPISREELSHAWRVNPDGAGFGYCTDEGKIKFERGFMNFGHFADTIEDLQTSHELLLHLRISTGAGVTPQGTHPYKAGNVLKMKGETDAPVIAMNGVIHGQTLETKRGALLNDTASYIKDHTEAFKVLNQDILEIVAENTSAKWAAVTGSGIIKSPGFKAYEGRYYSNLNHIAVWDYVETYTVKERLTLKDFLNKSIYDEICSDWELWDELEEYVWEHCNYQDCKACAMCVSEIKSRDSARLFLQANQYIDWLMLQGGDEF